MRSRFLICFLLISNILCAQEKTDYPVYPNPMLIPINLSATFGELRNNAFHAGLDIKTGGRIGEKVYAVADGYVSRIGVSPWGYGNVIYVTHDDGYTSVYAHLDKFNFLIGLYVKKKQMASKSFAQNVFPEKDEIRVSKGDFLGLSGNSGGSGGPHLHFEIRDANQCPVNPLFFGLETIDNVKPVIYGIALYPKWLSSVGEFQDAVYFGVDGKSGKYVVEQNIKANGTIYFGISTYDQSDEQYNKNGVYSIELFADNRLIFSILFDKYSYDETRYINSLIDYKRYCRDKVRFVRSEVDEYNILDLYGETSGCVTLKEGDEVHMKYVVKDFFGNTSTAKFTLVGDKSLEEYSDNQYGRAYYRVDGKSEVEVNLDGFTAKIPKKAFYKYEYVLARQIDTIENIASDYAYMLGTQDIPVQKNIEIKIRPAEQYANSDKLYMVCVSDKGEFEAVGGKLVDGKVTANVKKMGTYALALDETAPKIYPNNFDDNTKIIKTKRLKINVYDNESGISKYDIYLNDKWVVGAYDPKNDLLFYDVDEYMIFGNNKMEVVVTDGVGNETRKIYNIIRENPK